MHVCFAHRHTAGSLSGLFLQQQNNNERAASVFLHHTDAAEKTMATVASLATTCAFRPQETNPTFEDVGYGPLVVERQELRSEIIQQANPKRSVHISGCEGAGKTALLH